MPSAPGSYGPPITPREFLRTMADGTVKQLNPFSGTEVWTVPGRADRPLGAPLTEVRPLTDTDRTDACNFCPDRYLATPPETARSVRRGEGFERQYRLTLEEVLAQTAEFRRVPNLYEIIGFTYWRENFGYALPGPALDQLTRYLATVAGRDHLLSVTRNRLRTAAEGLSDAELLAYGSGYFGTTHDVIISRRHYTDDATTTAELASSGTLTPDEHAEYVGLTVDALSDIYAQNRYVRYVAVFQNWLRPAGASFDHLHKQLVGIDELGVQNELEVRAVRENPNVFNDDAVNYANYHGLVVAQNDHAVAFAGFGHRYPSLEVFSTSSRSEPWLMSTEEIRGMSDLLHALHAATGAEVASNEEWHHRPIDVDVPMPWHIVLKWRVSTPAGFEGGTKIYLNTMDPYAVRNRTLPALTDLRERGLIRGDIRIGAECAPGPNPLRYNPLVGAR